MPAQSDEILFAKQIEKFTDRIGMDYPLTVMKCTTRNTAMQLNMWELVMSFLNAWAHMYESGFAKPEHKIYRVARMASVMLRAAREDNETEPPRSTTGRHRCDD